MARGRSRSRSRSYSPRRRSRSPPRRKRYDEPHHRRRQSPAPCGLLVRNVALDTRPEELRIPFEKFGPVKDVYLPRNYYTGEPRGFAFVKFRFPEDAAEAKDRLNHKIVGGREIRIVYAEENRKTPQEMRKGANSSDPRDRSAGRRRTLSRSPRRRYHSRSRSPASRRRHRRSVSWSRSPRSAKSYKSTRTSLSPRDHSSDERACRKRRSRSPKDDLPHGEKEYKSSRRSCSPSDISPHREIDKSSMFPALKESSLHDRNHTRSPGKSVCPTKDPPLSKDCNAKQMEACPGVDHRSIKIAPGPQEVPAQEGSRGMSSQKISSSRYPSPDYERGYKLKQQSISPRENGGSPRMKAQSVASSRSLSYSPR